MLKEFANVQASLEDAIAILNKQWDDVRKIEWLTMHYPDEELYSNLHDQATARWCHYVDFASELFGISVTELIDLTNK